MQRRELLRFAVGLGHIAFIRTTPLGPVGAGSYAYIVAYDVVVSSTKKLQRVVEVLAEGYPVELDHPLDGGDMEGERVHYPSSALLRFLHVVVPHSRGDPDVRKLVELQLDPLEQALDDRVSGVLLEQPLRTSGVEATVIV